MSTTITVAINLIDDLDDDLNELREKLSSADWFALDNYLASVRQTLTDASVDEAQLTQAAEKIIAAFKAIPELADWFADTLSEIPSSNDERRLSTMPKSEAANTIKRLSNKMLKASDLVRQETQRIRREQTGNR